MRNQIKALFLILFFVTASAANAQLYKSNIRQYKVPLSVKAGDLIDSGSTISADSMRVTFKDEGYGPVNVDLKRMKHRKLKPGKIYERVSESIVIVASTGRSDELNAKGEKSKRVNTYPATGYVIDSKGIIVTNYHVAYGYVSEKNKVANQALVVMLKDGTMFPVEEILLADKSNDLAILRIDPKGVELPALPSATKEANIGEQVFIVSHPKQYYYAFSAGMVTDKFSELNWKHYRNLMAISADFAAGSSGAAIIDQYGNAMGTVTYTKTLQHSDDASKTQMVLKAIIPASVLLKVLEEGN